MCSRRPLQAVAPVGRSRPSHSPASEMSVRLRGARGGAPSWRESAAAVWCELGGESAPLRLSEGAVYALQHWDRLCWPHTRHKQWCAMLRRVVRHTREGGRSVWEEAAPGRYLLVGGSGSEGGTVRGRRRVRGNGMGRKRKLWEGEASEEEGVSQAEERAVDEWSDDGEDATQVGSSDDEDFEDVESRPRRRRRRATDDAAENRVGPVLLEDGGALDPGAAIPRMWLRPAPGAVRMSAFDIAPGLDVGEEGREVAGCKGWRTVRGTHGVVSGDWFYEVEVMRREGPGAVRVGWATRRSDVGTPVGFGGRSFGFRDLGGEFVKDGLLHGYGVPWGIGDVVGCLVRLPRAGELVRRQVAEADLRWLDFRFVHCMQGSPPPNCDVRLAGASMEWFVNGVSQGVPEEICAEGERESGMLAGRYYSAVSLFKDATARVNFGPDFRFPPPGRVGRWADLEVGERGDAVDGGEQ